MGRGVHKSLLIFRDHRLQAHERSILTYKKLLKGGRTCAWISKEVLTKLRYKTEAYKRWKQKYVT